MNIEQKLVIVKWNKECIKVLPIIPSLLHVLKKFVKEDKNRKHKKKALYLTYGNNYIPQVYWEECKKHTMVQLEIDSGNLEEIIQKNAKIEIALEALKEEKLELIDKKDDFEYDEKEIEEFKKNINELKKETRKHQASLMRTKDLDKIQTKKDIIAKCEKEIEELQAKIPEEITSTIEKIEAKENEIINKYTDYVSFPAKEREKIIEETYDIRSLEKFKDTELDGQLRLLIVNKINDVMNDQNDITIGHPKSHVKVS